MSVTFSIGSRVTCDLQHPDRWLNLSNGNAAGLLVWLGLPTDDLYGSIPARELAARCRRRLWAEARNVDPRLPDEHAGRCHFLGRPEGYLRTRTEELLRICRTSPGFPGAGSPTGAHTCHSRLRAQAGVWNTPPRCLAVPLQDGRRFALMFWGGHAGGLEPRPRRKAAEGAPRKRGRSERGEL